jgi:hypothetical protein
MFSIRWDVEPFSCDSNMNWFSDGPDRKIGSMASRIRGLTGSQQDAALMQTAGEMEPVSKETPRREKRDRTADGWSFFQQQDAVAVHGEQQRHGQTADPAPDHNIIIFFHERQLLLHDEHVPIPVRGNHYIASPPLMPIT